MTITKDSIEYPQLHELVSVVHGDLRDLDISSATVIVLYLLPESIQLILEMLVNALKNGSIIICNTVGYFIWCFSCLLV